MKHFYFIFIIALLASCQSVDEQDSLDKEKEQSKHMITVNGKQQLYNFKKYDEPRIEISIGSGKNASRAAASLSDDQIYLSELKKLPLTELTAKLKDANPHKTCLIIEALAVKGKVAVPTLFSLIADERPVELKKIEVITHNKKKKTFKKFLRADEAFWVEGKQAGKVITLPMTINLYALYNAYIVTHKSAYGAKFDKKKDYYFCHDNQGGMPKAQTLSIWKLWWKKNSKYYASH